MTLVSSHVPNLSIVDPQGLVVERAEQERVERERVEREREQERVEQELLFRRLKPADTGYHRKLCCMDGT